MSEKAAPSLGQEMLASGVGGCLADGLTYPMCTVKNRLQLGASRQGAVVYRGPLDALGVIIRTEGVGALFKGVSTVLPVLPAQALYMGGYQGFRRLAPGDPDSPAVQFAGGIVATLTQSIAMVPLEVVRQRQQVQTAADAASGAGYRGSLHAAATIARVEGPMALYRGFGITQAVWAPFNAVYLPLWEGIKRLGVTVTGCGDTASLPVRWELGASTMASAFAAAISNPADVVKTRLQVSGASNVAAPQAFDSAWQCARHVARTEGMQAFMRGATGRVLWVAPSTAIMFTCAFQSRPPGLSPPLLTASHSRLQRTTT